MSAPSEGVAFILAGAAPPIGEIPSNVGLTVGAWQIGVGKMTDKPDQQIVCYDTTGHPPNPKWLLDYPAVQVVVRGAPQGYQAASQKATDVTDILLGQFPRTINGDSWDAITVISASSFIGYDDADRPQFSLNVLIILEPAASAYTHRLPLGT